jgi:hypothetical protein
MDEIIELENTIRDALPSATGPADRPASQHRARYQPNEGSMRVEDIIADFLARNDKVLKSPDDAARELIAELERHGWQIESHGDGLACPMCGA